MDAPPAERVRARHGALRSLRRRVEPHVVPWAPLQWVGASLFFAASLTPSLYPRPALAQGIVSGISLVLGRLTGRAVGAAVAWVPTPRVSAAARSITRQVVAGCALCVSTAGLLFNHRWQADVGRLLNTDVNGVGYLASVVIVAIATAAGLLVIGWLLRAGRRRYVRLVERLVAGPARAMAHVVIIGGLLVLVVDIVVADELVAVANDRLVMADARFDASVARPRSSYRSGSPASLVPWASLGRAGRAFVAGGPSVEELEGFHQAPPVPPIRVYVGLGARRSNHERAELAVAELDRTGAFDREVLVVITPTGTGAVNRHAIGPLEYMYNGDVASVAIQYSYLPSWVVMGGNQDRAEAAARALFEAVTRRLDQRPPARRPQLLLYGESLGSFGSERLFRDLDDVRRSTDGVLWVGPPRANHLWRQLTAARDVGSPVWQPVYRNGEAVRFGHDGAALTEPPGPWTAPRVAYLQHPTDPVTWWTPELLLRRPEWLDGQRPFDVSHAMPYIPVVTFLQTTVDLVLGANAPLGHGHMFGTEQAEAWALVADPAGWSHADTVRLLRTVESRLPEG